LSRIAKIPGGIVLDGGGTPVENIRCDISESEELDDMPGPFRKFRIDVIPVDPILSRPDPGCHKLPMATLEDGAAQ